MSVVFEGAPPAAFRCLIFSKTQTLRTWTCWWVSRARGQTHQSITHKETALQQEKERLDHSILMFKSQKICVITGPKTISSIKRPQDRIKSQHQGTLLPTDWWLFLTPLKKIAKETCRPLHLPVTFTFKTICCFLHTDPVHSIELVFHLCAADLHFHPDKSLIHCKTFLHVLPNQPNMLHIGFLITVNSRLSLAIKSPYASCKCTICDCQRKKALFLCSGFVFCYRSEGRKEFVW